MAEIARQENGAGRVLRLDPYQSTHHMEIGSKTYKLDRNGAVVRTRLSCGLEMSLAVPARAFKGVAARAIEDEAGNLSVSLELMHHDAELCVPLLHADNLDDIAADWHSWSRLMKLPMLVVGLDGEPTAVQKLLGDIMIEDPEARRRRITTPRYRPNFLRRRKPGIVGKVEKISAHELIARC